MQNKLQELTDKLYNEGLSKGKQEGAAILENAKAEAREIVTQAQKEAEAIIAQAHKEAEDLKTKVESDVKMAAAQSIAATKKDIESLIVTKVSQDKVKAAIENADFIKEMISSVAKAFGQEATELEVILPESLKAELEPFIETELAALLKGGVTASFSKKIAGGFTIAPKDGGYFISLTEETFNLLIGEYLRPATKKILFG